VVQNSNRARKIEESRKIADNHGQLWSAEEDNVVIQRNCTGEAAEYMEDDMVLAAFLGRTFVAVSQRRVVLTKMLDSGMTLEEIHDVERHRRAVRNNRTYSVNIGLMAAMCPECFCYPHIPGCSQE
jgi:hypothetical protein